MNYNIKESVAPKTKAKNERKRTTLESHILNKMQKALHKKIKRML